MASHPAPVWKTRLIAAFRLLAQAILILAISVFVLVQRGTTMCDPFFLLPLSLFSALLVGPILVDQFRRHPDRSAARLVTGAAARASGVVLLILALSLALVNLASWYGHALLPTAETCIWTVVLSITSAVAAGAGLLLLGSRGSMTSLQWISRALGLAAVLVYKYLPAEWSSSWYGFVLDWGISTTALAFAGALVSIAAGALLVLKRRERATAPVIASEKSLAF